MNENAKRLNRWYQLNVDDNEISCADFINNFATNDMKNFLTFLGSVDDKVLNFALKTILQVFDEAQSKAKTSKTGFRADIGQDRSVGIFSIHYLLLSKPTKLWAEDENGSVINLPLGDNQEIAEIKKFHRLNCYIGLENYTKLDTHNNKVVTTKIFVVNQLEHTRERVNLFECYHVKGKDIVIKKTTGFSNGKTNNHFNFWNLQDIKTKEYTLSYKKANEQIL